MKQYVSALIFNEAGQFLILRRSHTAPWKPLHWNLPAGHVEMGEQPYLALARELKDEMHLDLPAHDFWFRKKIQSPGCVEYYFNVPMTTEQQMLMTLNYENDGIAWVDPATMHQYKLVPDLADRITEILVTPNISVVEPGLLKALSSLLGEAKPDVDALLKAGVAKGTHKKDNPDYEPIMGPGNKVIGYRKKSAAGGSEAKPKKPGHVDVVRQGVAHPVGSRVAFKTRDGNVVTGSVHKHGADHKDFGKLIHVKTDDGKEYTRYAHNVKQTTEAKKAEAKKDEPDKGKDAKADTSHLHPIGAKVTVKNRKGERVAGEVVKHGEDHGAKGQLIHVKTDHGTYIRYNHNTSRTETGEQVKEKVEVKPEPKAKPEPVKKLTVAEKKAAADKVKADESAAAEKMKWDIARNDVDRIDARNKERSIAAGGTGANTLLDKYKAMNYWERQTERRRLSEIQHHWVSTQYEKVKSSKAKSKMDMAHNYRKDIIRNERLEKEFDAADKELYAKDPQIAALSKAMDRLDPKVKREIAKGQEVLKVGLESEKKLEFSRDQNSKLVKVAPMYRDLHAAQHIQHNAQSIRNKRYAKLLSEFVKTGNPIAGLVVKDGPEPSFAERKKAFTYTGPDGATWDKRIDQVCNKHIPDVFFDNLPGRIAHFNTGTAKGTAHYTYSQEIYMNKNTWADEVADVTLHEYGHYFHHATGLHGGGKTCPIANHIFKVKLKEEFDALPDSVKMRLNKGSIMMGSSKLGAMHQDKFRKVETADSIAAVTNTEYGFGHDVEYYKDKPDSQMCELFTEFLGSHLRDNATLRELFPNTHKLSNAYFDQILVKRNAKS